MASFVYLILYLYFHTCITTARSLMVQDKENFVLPQFPSEEGLAIRSNSNTYEIIPLGNKKSSVAKETETIKTSYTWKRLLHQATATEIHKTEQSTFESTPNKVEETINSKESEPVADVVVMDYAQPHRKPPIHNKGT